MEVLLSQIKTAIDNNLYFLALNATLSLPDMCGALSSKDGQAHANQYITWYNKYAKDKCCSNLDGFHCYKFRCASVHQGSTQHENLGYSRVLFIEPSASRGLVMHNNLMNDALNIDLKLFCYGMIDAVTKWLSEVKDDPIFISNYSKFMKRYPTGLSPYISGVSVIS